MAARSRAARPPYRCYLDGYRYVIRFADGRRILRARFLMECKLGRSLSTHEQVRHRDFDQTNDDLENLYIFERFPVRSEVLS